MVLRSGTTTGPRFAACVNYDGGLCHDTTTAHQVGFEWDEFCGLCVRSVLFFLYCVVFVSDCALSIMGIVLLCMYLCVFFTSGGEGWAVDT